MLCLELAIVLNPFCVIYVIVFDLKIRVSKFDFFKITKCILHGRCINIFFLYRNEMPHFLNPFFNFWPFYSFPTCRQQFGKNKHFISFKLRLQNAELVWSKLAPFPSIHERQLYTNLLASWPNFWANLSSEVGVAAATNWLSWITHYFSIHDSSLSRVLLKGRNSRNSHQFK